MGMYQEISLRFFFNDTATTEIYTLSLHDALPISVGSRAPINIVHRPSPLDEGAPLGAVTSHHPDTRDLPEVTSTLDEHDLATDRKSTRLNSSHANISYAVFCLKKKKKF